VPCSSDRTRETQQQGEGLVRDLTRWLKNL
jgi:hypothetical protein